MTDMWTQSDRTDDEDRRRRAEAIVAEAEAGLRPAFSTIEAVELENVRRVLDAFRRHRVGEGHFAGSTGYGYHDLGRETLEAVFADVFGGEAAIVRPHLLSGTHAIAASLFGLLLPGDNLVIATGEPYDTLRPVIGPEGRGQGNLLDYGIAVRIVPLRPDGGIHLDKMRAAIDERTAVVFFQRSRGYQERRSFFVAELAEAIRAAKMKNAAVTAVVDNCYGEFVEPIEPLHAGADVLAGSLIKNPGGGLVRVGGYIVGRRAAIERIAARLVAPGIGLAVGAAPGGWREFYQGLFLAPHVVAEALKGAHLTAAVMQAVGFPVDPPPGAPRTDLIQSISFGDRETLLRFAEAVQAHSPVESFVRPTPGAMPGYRDPVVMAAGTFVQGASIELSADAPLRPPYRGYLQGGLMYAHVKLALIGILVRLAEAGRIAL
ncbi:MAG: Aluminum resistance protein [Hydrogenibacillus schlegelii]|uniref:Aluminum resistance protein n=2 Tax=Hydrogenibacillus schlegelii TaxID=1484 RepID=A0A2T5GEP9_HYDSH|nr:MAG: Aluminum resistance protein [Hydrogenibacillus schlegelii]